MTKDIKKPNHFFLVLILGFLNAITPFSIDMYLPAFPQIAKALNTTIAHVSFSVSSYFIGYAIGQIIYGPLLDRFGRKPPLYVGLIIYILASTGCLLSQNIEMLLVFRFVQALGGCAASVAAIAMVRDFFPVKEGAKIFSLLILILGLSPLLAPTIGGFLVSSFSWHFIFALLSIIVFIILLVVIFILPEGHAPDHSVSLKPRPILATFKYIITMPQFIVYVLSGSFLFASLFVYVSASPTVFMTDFKLSPKTFGGVFALLSVGMIGGSQLNHVLNKKFRSEAIFQFALLLQFFVCVIFLIGELNNWYGLVSIICLLFIVLFCAGLLFPNASAIAMAPFEKHAGSASSLLGFIQIGIGGLISAFSGAIKGNATLSMAVIMFICSVIGASILLLGKRKIAKNLPVQTNAELVK